MYSFFILDVMKSSSNSFQVTLCLGVKKKNLSVYTKKSHHKSTFTMYNFKVPYADAQIGLQERLGVKSPLGFCIYPKGGEVHSNQDLVSIVGI